MIDEALEVAAAGDPALRRVITSIAAGWDRRRHAVTRRGVTGEALYRLGVDMMERAAREELTRHLLTVPGGILIPAPVRWWQTRHTDYGALPAHTDVSIDLDEHPGYRRIDPRDKAVGRTPRGPFDLFVVEVRAAHIPDLPEGLHTIMGAGGYWEQVRQR